MKDIVRATIVVKAAEGELHTPALRALVSELKAECDKGEGGLLRVVRHKNRMHPDWSASEAGGYRDILLNVKLPGWDLTAEVQL